VETVFPDTASGENCKGDGDMDDPGEARNFERQRLNAYTPHRAWEIPLYRAVAQHFETFLAAYPLRGNPVPFFAVRDFRAFPALPQVGISRVIHPNRPRTVFCRPLKMQLIRPIHRRPVVRNRHREGSEHAHHLTMIIVPTIFFVFSRMPSDRSAVKLRESSPASSARNAAHRVRVSTTASSETAVEGAPARPWPATSAAALSAAAQTIVFFIVFLLFQT
jgi:hypothetical protein